MELTQHQIAYCMECGVCTGSCPVSVQMPSFSPRQIIKRALVDADDQVIHSPELWACLTCARCSVRCPAEIDFPEFARSLRQKARAAGNQPQESHHGILQTIAHVQTAGIRQKRTEWAKASGGRFADKGDYFYFVGCLPYFDVVFEYLNISPLDGARGVLALLNACGVAPVISDEERCCGHDALYSGDEATFKILARKNIDTIVASGAKTVLIGCPEGYLTFKRHYPAFFGDLPFAVEHLSDFFARQIPAAGLTFAPSTNGGYSFQDPCRLGRMEGHFDQPRQLVQLVPDAKLTEMASSRQNAQCCGTSAWMACSSCSKAMQVERLNEFKDTGASTLITACPKCQIHLTCAAKAVEMPVAIKDMYAFLAGQLAKPE